MYQRLIIANIITRHLEGLLLRLIYNLVLSRCQFQRFPVLGNETINVAHTFFFQNLVNGDENTRFFNVTETIIDSRSEEFHRGTKPHVGVNQRRNVISQRTNFAIQDLVVFLKAGRAE